MAWKKSAAVAVLSAAAATALAAPQTVTIDGKKLTIPEAPREFRGVWVATVANIDWPSRKGLSTEQQQKELIAILDRVRELNMNVVVLQIRPAADALYKSDLEPWSEYLTGEQGKAPEPFYDPLEFAVEEAHKRGLELHVWFNPYRARLLRADKSTSSGYSAPPADPNHISVRHPEVVKEYGAYQWMDPGEKIVQDHSMAVILDVVNRYDIDGVHMDDYFYPYPVNDPQTGKEVDFPDEPSWTRYKESGGKLSRADWRRKNVDDFIERLYTEVKKTKRHVLVGLSPFGIWQPGYPENVKGFNQYEKLYADAKLWLNRGWVDYWTPQLYWRIQDLNQSYPELLQWWMKENTRNRHVWPGLFTTKPNFGPDEIINQIVITRFLGATGNVHFSMKGFLGEGKLHNLNERLTTATGVYARPALIPATSWLGGRAPKKPVALNVQPVESPEDRATIERADDGSAPADEETTGTESASQDKSSESSDAPAQADDTATTTAQESASDREVTTGTAELKTADEGTTTGDRRAAWRERRGRRGVARQSAAQAQRPASPRKKVELSWQPASDSENVRVYAVYTGSNVGGTVAWKFHLVPGSQTSLQIEADDKGNFPAYYAVSAVSGTLGLASPYAVTTYAPAVDTQSEEKKETYGQVQ